jgi:hypothetical protein
VLVTCWSVKGGSGTTVVAAALAVLLSRRLPEGVLLVDGGGDVGCALGLAESGGPGLAEWLAAPAEVGADALGRLLVEAGGGGGGGLAVLPRGTGAVDVPGGAGRLLAALDGDPEGTTAMGTGSDAARGRLVVVDAGPPSPFAFELAASSTVSLLVIRPCFLALRRALAAPVRPSGVVVVEEPGRRSLDAGDVEDALGVPVHAVVPWDEAIARSVDAGLLGTRLPRPLATALRAAA